MLARVSKEVIYQLTLRRSHQLWQLPCRRHSSTARLPEQMIPYHAYQWGCDFVVCMVLFYSSRWDQGWSLCHLEGVPTRRPLMQLLFRGPVPTAKGVGLCNTTRARTGPIPSAVSSSWLPQSMASRGCSRSLYHPPVWSHSGYRAALPVDHPDTNRPPKFQQSKVNSTIVTLVEVQYLEMRPTAFAGA